MFSLPKTPDWLKRATDIASNMDLVEDRGADYEDTKSRLEDRQADMKSRWGADPAWEKMSDDMKTGMALAVDAADGTANTDNLFSLATDWNSESNMTARMAKQKKLAEKAATIVGKKPTSDQQSIDFAGLTFNIANDRYSGDESGKIWAREMAPGFTGKNSLHVAQNSPQSRSYTQSAIDDGDIGNTVTSDMQASTLAPTGTGSLKTESNRQRHQRINRGRADDNLKENMRHAADIADDWFGMDKSAKHFRHFLDGNGQDIHSDPRDDEDNQYFVDETLETNRQRFEDHSFLGEGTGAPDALKIKKIKDGETISLSDEWDNDQGKLEGLLKALSHGKIDNYLTWGTQKGVSQADYKATRKGKKIYLSGKVNQNFDDIYDFAPEEFEAYRLQESGRGKNYKNIRRFDQGFSGTVDILNEDEHGELILGNPQIQWAGK